MFNKDVFDLKKKTIKHSDCVALFEKCKEMELLTAYHLQKAACNETNVEEWSSTKIPVLAQTYCDLRGLINQLQRIVTDTRKKRSITNSNMISLSEQDIHVCHSYMSYVEENTDILKHHYLISFVAEKN